jgi:3D (Asp-Asp-Asp) domain-containing protein
MGFLRKNRIKRLLISAWAAVAALSLCVNVSYAHYEKGTEGALAISLPGSGATQVYLTTDAVGEGWSETEDGYRMGFTLSNGVSAKLCASESQTVSVRVFATAEEIAATEETAAVENKESTLTLTVDGYTLNGAATAVTEDSVFYKKYGPGQLYCFCTGAGEEMDWTLLGGVFSEIPMELTVKDGAAGTSYVVMTNADIKGWNKDYLYARIPEKSEETEESTYSYLTEDGQNVLMGALDDTMAIDLGEKDCKVESNSERVTATIDDTKLKLTVSEPPAATTDEDSTDETETFGQPEDQQTAGEIAVQEHETDDTESSDQPETPEIPETIEIRVTSSDGNRSATFVLNETTETTSGTVTLNNEQYYNPTVPIIATTNTGAVISGFPAKTKVTIIGGETYVLGSDDLPVTIPAGGTAVFDLSDTGYTKALTIQSAVKQTLSYFDLPTVAEDSPTVLGNTGLILSLPYQWGNSAAPTVTIERYTKENDTFGWSKVDTVICEPYSATSEVSFRSDGAEAGSYRATLTWTDQSTGTELLTYSFPFYVSYPEQTAGDQSVAYSYVGGQTHGALTGGETITVNVTYYCGCTACCDDGATGYTASGEKVISGMVAMSEQYPIGTKIVIDGVVYTVEDRGGEITDNDVDIYVPSHTAALRGGKREATAIVYLPSETDSAN